MMPKTCTSLASDTTRGAVAVGAALVGQENAKQQNNTTIKSPVGLCLIASYTFHSSRLTLHCLATALVSARDKGDPELYREFAWKQALAAPRKAPNVVGHS